MLKKTERCVHALAQPLGLPDDDAPKARLCAFTGGRLRREAPYRLAANPGLAGRWADAHQNRSAWPSGHNPTSHRCRSKLVFVDEIEHASLRMLEVVLLEHVPQELSATRPCFHADSAPVALVAVQPAPWRFPLEDVAVATLVGLFEITDAL